jgi:hypothetical protein
MKTLAKQHGFLSLSEIAPPGSNSYQVDAASNDWRKVQGNEVFVSETFFDLAGMAQEEKTLFFEGMAVQEAQPHAIVSTAAAKQGNCFLLYDIVTSISVDWDTVDLTGWATNGFGFPGSILNFEHVLYQRMRRYTLDVDTGAAFPLKADDIQSGSMAPTASDRLYCYRVVSPFPFTGITQIGVAPARYLLNAEPKEEPTYQHLMRLKRSYDLQQTTDVD